MALTPSTMLPLGTPAPEFRLRDVNTSKMVSLDDFKTSPALLIMFICNHCPYVKHVRAGLADLTNEYLSRGVGIVGISSNDVATHPDDGPEKMVEEAIQAGYRFPYLFDETQQVAHAYHAACTPDFFLFDGEQKLAYRGQLDDSRPGNGIPVTGKDLRQAIEAVLAHQPIPAEQRPSIGCNIKWKAGNEPAYFAKN
ncbi:thioredoxin family protein [bacterium]|nr:thioredoxin family protein [bacterium]